MGSIFAIGGGEISQLETLDIDKKIVKSVGKENPKALFIPTASGEPQGYIDSFKHVYGELLGCETDVLLLVEGKTSPAEAREQIMAADLVYVGGGNTRKMLQIWEQYGVDQSLKEAYEKGKTLSGLSAGSICWFKSGHSDTESFDAEGTWNYVRIEALELIDAMHCPHYNEDNREEDFNQKILDYGEVGIAIENNCAIEVKGPSYLIHKSQPQAKAYKLFQEDGEVIKEELENTKEYKPIEDLLQIIPSRRRT
ncbi:peptidase E [Jeotgalibaca caeni]|uniref:peptidase E n=1 Tax=Jeotgalibaca caeni TaxID=3028623 RepID=UPI00237E52BB|nr:peptidase E [Jeotgalibaca caeni]MDE1547791.1 peptidase E [Jeotgalibaca caeni]